MMATLPLPFRSLTACSPRTLASREVVDAVVGVALRLRRVGVPGHHRDARVDRLVDRFGEEVAVERRDGDAVDLLGDEGLEELLLLQLVGRRRGVPENVDVAVFLRLPLGADLRVAEHGDIERLRDHGESQPLRPFRRLLTAAAPRDTAQTQRNTTASTRLLRIYAPLPEKQLIHDHDHDDHQTHDQSIVERRAGNLRQRVSQHAENQRAEHRADDRPAPAGEARAADDRRGNDIQLVAVCQIGFRLPLDERQDDARRPPARRPASA